MVARQESSALLGCRKKVFENARQMWFLVAAHLSSCHGGCGHDDAPWSAAWRCISKDLLRAGKEVPQSAFCLAYSPEFKPQYEQLNFFHPFLPSQFHCSAHAQCTKK